MKKYIALVAFSTIAFVSCNNDDNGTITDPDPGPGPGIEVTSGTADLSNYVAIGNSLAAGFSDGALFIDGQKASFPNLMATQFKLAGGGDFKQPLMADNLGGATIGGERDLNGDDKDDIGNRLILSFLSGSPTPTPVSGEGSTEIKKVITGPFKNMGVPGAKSFHLGAPGYGNELGLATGAANPYFVRMATTPNTSIIADALAQTPSFFSLWIGANDVLSYATGGGTGVDHNATNNIDPRTYTGSDITNINVFKNVYNQYLQGLTANNTPGILANIPDINSIPFFTTVPHNPLEHDNEEFSPQIPALNKHYSAINLALSNIGVPERAISFSTTGASALVMKDETLTNLTVELVGELVGFGLDLETASLLGFLYGQARQATEEDLIVLPTRSIIAKLNNESLQSLIAQGVPAENAGMLSINGLTLPLADQWVLTVEEQDAIANGVTLMNTAIAEFGTLYNLPVVDTNGLLTQIAGAGIELPDGSIVTDTYATGGAFSLDGVHPTPRGNAIIANFFLAAINEKHGSNFPGVNPLDYTGLYIK